MAERYRVHVLFSFFGMIFFLKSHYSSEPIDLKGKHNLNGNFFKGQGYEQKKGVPFSGTPDLSEFDLFFNI